MRGAYQFGLHSIRVEEDIVLLKYVGGASPEEFERQNAIFAEFGEHMTRMYLLIDLSEAGLSNPNSRKYAAENSSGRVPLATICFGASMLIRTAALMVTGAARILGRSKADMQFVATEDEARARVTSLRAAPVPNKA
ncbi:MAG TPA: hypothetical protein PKI03_02490 [Pseudomonadota bacterium]|nr:hypothetical protein [Pseudomonadota bacterium]